jgi:hypothetical protein
MHCEGRRVPSDMFFDYPVSLNPPKEITKETIERTHHDYTP